jgi:glycosyltransferase involved in cell wall biosynthesis
MGERARREVARNPRYHWMGEWPHEKALRLLAACQAMVLSSKMEGGANVISEAIWLGVPVIASRIDGSIGLLGRTYRGYFPFGDTGALARLLRRLETDGAFYASLYRHCFGLRPLFRPAREREAWRGLLKQLT